MKIIPADIQTEIKKSVVIQSIDQNWKEHLQKLDFLKGSIGLRAYGQQNPLNAYKQEAFRLFEGLLSRVRERVVRILAYAEFQIKPTEAPEQQKSANAAKSEKSIDPNTPRNAPCPCGSGKKFKHCCGKVD